MVEYSNQVLNGEVPACQKHKQACQRFLSDLEKEGTENFPYVFKNDKAMRFFKFMRQFNHTKGKLAGQPKEPAPIEIFIFGNIYGWYHKDTGYRRFKKGYWQVARKNAKSQDLAIVGLYELAGMKVDSSEVYVGATKKEQANIVWNEADKMYRNSDTFSDKFETKYSKIIHEKSESFMKPLSKEDRKTGDGLNPQCGIIDEYHAHKTSEIYDILDSGMGARQQPLLMIITTAGYDTSKPCYRVEYKYIEQILDPDNPVENDKYFVMVNELDKNDDGELADNIKDEEVWRKANPILASYEEGREYLKDQVQTALDVPDKKKMVLTKNLNVWLNAKENGYMKLGKWKACGSNRVPDLSEATVFVGVDLSTKLDLTSVGFLFLLPGNKYYVKSHSFLPEDRLQEKVKTDKIPYDQWVREGWITTTDGEVVDYRYIMDYIIEQEKQSDWSIHEICYDPYNATQFAQEIAEHGYEMVEIRQGAKTLSEPTKDFRAQVYEKNVTHNRNPVLSWAIGNAVTKQDHNENIQLDKNKSTQRIDPIAAVINAHVRAVVSEPKEKSPYEERGILFL